MACSICLILISWFVGVLSLLTVLCCIGCFLERVIFGVTGKLFFQADFSGFVGLSLRVTFFGCR